MSTITQILIVAALVLSIFVPFSAFLIGERNKGRLKTSLAINAFLFFGIFAVAGIVSLGNGASALAAEAASESSAGLATGLGYLAAALVTGLSCIGGGIAVASAASAALGAISEDQSILGKSLIFVGLAEGCCLYGLIISFMSDNVDTYTGMRLAGVEGCVVHERGELREALERAIADKENGIILLTEKFGREFPDIVDDVKLNRRLPLIVEIPDRHGTGRKADFITSYVNEAIGVKL